MFFRIAPPNKSSNTRTNPGGVWVNMAYVSRIEEVINSPPLDPVTLVMRQDTGYTVTVNKDNAGPGMVEEILKWLKNPENGFATCLPTDAPKVEKAKSKLEPATA